MTTLKKKSVREEVWLRTCGERFSHPCITRWCSNRITVFDFHVAHNIPSSRGGMNTFENLKPMCARCNYAMGNRYTIDEWQRVMSVSNELAESVEVDPTLSFEASESAVPDGEPTTSAEPSESVAGEPTTSAEPSEYAAGEPTTSVEPSESATGEPTTSVEPSESVAGEPTTSVEPSESVAGEPTTSAEPSESAKCERKVKRRTFKIGAHVIS